MKCRKNRRFTGHLLLLFFVWLPLLESGCNNREEHPAQNLSASAPQPPEGVIVALGDSLSAGYGLDPEQAYPSVLQRKLKARRIPYRVINAGVSGETSTGCLARLDWVMKLHPDIVILETGANDGMRGIDPAMTRDNIQAIIHRLHAEEIIVILAGMRMLPNLGQTFTDTFDAIYPALAESHAVIFMPFFLKDVAGIPDLNQADGIHPTPRGTAIVVENLWPYVQNAITRHKSRHSP